MSVTGPSDAAVEAAAVAGWRADEALNATNSAELGHGLVKVTPWDKAHGAEREEWRRSARVALAAAYAIDMPRIRAEARAGMRDEIVAWLREADASILVYDDATGGDKLVDAASAVANDFEDADA